MAEPAADPLLTALAQGREDALAALYDRFGPALFRTALLLLGSRRTPRMPCRTSSWPWCEAGTGWRRSAISGRTCSRLCAIGPPGGLSCGNAIAPSALTDVPEPAAAEARQTDAEQSHRLERPCRRCRWSSAS